jgi:hypothetical protein
MWRQGKQRPTWKMSKIDRRIPTNGKMCSFLPWKPGRKQFTPAFATNDNFFFLDFWTRDSTWKVGTEFEIFGAENGERIDGKEILAWERKWWCPLHKLWRICKKCLGELTQCLTLSQFAQTFLTNPSKLRIYPCKIPTVNTETLIV